MKFEKEPVYLSAESEEGKIFTQANIEVDDQGNIIPERVKARKESDFPIVDRT